MTTQTAAYPVETLRAQFPVLSGLARGKPLVYLDNGATTQKPLAVLNALDDFQRLHYGTIHRGVYELSEKATQAYEGARKIAQRFLNAPSEQEIVFTSGTTDSLNLAASCLSRGLLKEGDEVIITAMEHHANIVPWQMQRDERGIVLKVAPMTAEGELNLDDLKALITSRTKVISAVHVSNALGTINPVRQIADLAHEAGAVMVVDGAQSAGHMDIDVQALGADFFAFSGHKIYGPTGCGVLWGKMDLLEKLPPYRGGGDMILNVTFEKTTFAKPPARFEAGTPPIAEVIGLGKAMEFLLDIGRENIGRHEHGLMVYAMEQLSALDGVRLIGTAKQKAGAVSFYVEAAHPHDVASVLDGEGVAIRAGHHCAQPIMDFFGIPATARASLGLYNTRADIDALAAAVKKVIEMFS